MEELSSQSQPQPQPQSQHHSHSQFQFQQQPVPQLHHPQLDFGGRVIVCPYNLNHRIDPMLFPDHLRECRLRYCRQNGQNLRLIRCKVNSRHWLPEVEIPFHERQCEDAVYRQIVEELKTEPVPVKVPSSDSSDDDEKSDRDDDSSVSSGDTEYSTSKDEFLRRILQDHDD